MERGNGESTTANAMTSRPKTNQCPAFVAVFEILHLPRPSKATLVFL